MGRVFVSTSSGAEVYVFSDDHCPPHVHAHHRREGWIARVSFSYVDEAIALMSIAPMRNAPLRRVVNRLLDDIQERLGDCRRVWWTIRGTTCLANQWVVVLPDGRAEPRPKRTKDAQQIADAVYEPSSGELEVRFRDGKSWRVK